MSKCAGQYVRRPKVHANDSLVLKTILCLCENNLNNRIRCDWDFRYGKFINSARTKKIPKRVNAHTHAYTSHSSSNSVNNFHWCRSFNWKIIHSLSLQLGLGSWSYVLRDLRMTLMRVSCVVYLFDWSRNARLRTSGEVTACHPGI